MNYKEMFDEVIRSGKYPDKINKISALAQLIYANDRTKDKTDCVYEALEKYEEMTGIFFDPTRDQFERIRDEII